MTGGTLSEAAQKAVAAWGVTHPAPRLISHRENAVFDIHLPDGQRAALRLHRPGYSSVSDIQSELWWMQELAATGFPTPRPIAALDGELLVQLKQDQVATVITWNDGAPIGTSGVPLDGSQVEQGALFQRLGKLLARLHTISDTLALPAGFTRRSWDCEGLLGPDPHWGRFWAHPALTPDIHDLLIAARDKAYADITAYGASGASYGLIHADALRENVFQSDAGLSLIDFDDAGFGFRLYDLAVTVSQSIDDANYQHLRDAVFEGYSQDLPVGQAEIDLFPAFAMCRCFASLGWAIPRLPYDDPSVQKFAGRAQRAATAFLAS